MTPVLKFNYGKELWTSQFVAYPQGCKTKKKYDEVCDCAYEITLQSQNADKDNVNNKANTVSEIEKFL